MAKTTQTQGMKDMFAIEMWTFCFGVGLNYSEEVLGDYSGAA